MCFKINVDAVPMKHLRHQGGYTDGAGDVDIMYSNKIAWTLISGMVRYGEAREESEKRISNRK